LAAVTPPEISFIVVSSNRIAQEPACFRSVQRFRSLRPSQISPMLPAAAIISLGTENRKYPAVPKSGR